LNDPPEEAGNRRKISALTETTLSALTNALIFWETYDCQIIEFPHRPALGGLLQFWGEVFLPERLRGRRASYSPAAGVSVKIL